MKLSPLTLSLLALAGVSALAQSSPTTTGKAGATILTEIGIVRVTDNDKGPGAGFNKVSGVDLYFGRFLKPTATVTAVLRPDATYAAPPAGYKDGAYTPGYELTAGDANIAVTVSATPIEVISDKATTPATATATQRMDVTDFTFGLTANAGNEGTPGSNGNGSFITGATKKVHFNVGATLTLKAGQEPGLYTGTYTLTTAYN